MNDKEWMSVWWRVWIYQRSNQNMYSEEEQTTQWPKEKSTKRQTMIYKTYTSNLISSNPNINLRWYLQGSILSTKMVAWATKFHLWRPKFKSGGQHDHQHNWGWRPEILDNFPSERGKYWTISKLAYRRKHWTWRLWLRG